jgi:DNA-binding response OmpR family regulator
VSYSILIVDDEPDVLMLCRVNLEFEGYNVVEAHGGEEAVEIVRRGDIDLVLLDVMMPGMDGWEVLSSIRRNPQTAEIPVIMLTAKAEERDQIRGWSDGANDYVTKPFNPIALSETVRRALQPLTEEERERRRHDMLKKLRLIQTSI